MDSTLSPLLGEGSQYPPIDLLSWDRRRSSITWETMAHCLLNVSCVHLAPCSSPRPAWTADLICDRTGMASMPPAWREASPLATDLHYNKKVTIVSNSMAQSCWVQGALSMKCHCACHSPWKVTGLQRPPASSVLLGYLRTRLPPASDIGKR